MMRPDIAVIRKRAAAAREDVPALCDYIEHLEARQNPLRAFASAILDGFPDTAPDCFQIQDLAVEHGILKGHEVTESCGEYCWCAEYYGEWPATCYRRTELIEAKEGE